MTNSVCRLVTQQILGALSPVRSEPLVVGLSGPQGSGKSTTARQVEGELTRRGFRVAALSLDDLYLHKSDRLALAAFVHPLLDVRGPPGTHCVETGLAILREVRKGGSPFVPVFDKLHDDVAPASEWRQLAPELDVLIFEGWCVGARAEPDLNLLRPINILEEIGDEGGIWRRYVNAQLRGDYQRLFSHLDLTVFLDPGDFSVVSGWRYQQERNLVAAAGTVGKSGMSIKDVKAFTQYYERISRWMMRDMPDRADLLIKLGRDRNIAGYASRFATR